MCSCTSGARTPWCVELPGIDGRAVQRAPLPLLRTWQRGRFVWRALPCPASVPSSPACVSITPGQVITSSDLPGWQDHVTVLASTTLPQAGGGPQRLRLRVPRVHAYFTGTGGLEGLLGCV